jgi:hypothetical protein
LAKCRLVGQPYAVSENADVFSQSALLVEHIPAHMRTFAEQDIKRSADRCTCSLQWAIGHDLT